MAIDSLFINSAILLSNLEGHISSIKNTAKSCGFVRKLAAAETYLVPSFLVMLKTLFSIPNWLKISSSMYLSNFIFVIFSITFIKYVNPPPEYRNLSPGLKYTVLSFPVSSLLRPLEWFNTILNVIKSPLGSLGKYDSSKYCRNGLSSSNFPSETRLSAAKEVRTLLIEAAWNSSLSLELYDFS